MFQICHSFYNPTDSGAVQITQSNLDMVLGELHTNSTFSWPKLFMLLS